MCNACKACVLHAKHAPRKILKNKPSHIESRATFSTNFKCTVYAYLTIAILFAEQKYVSCDRA